MKNVNGQFTGKIKVSNDSKYMHGQGLDEDIRNTKNKLDKMKKELNEVLEKYRGQFRHYKTAEDEYIEILRNEVIKILKRRGEL